VRRVIGVGVGSAGAGGRVWYKRGLCHTLLLMVCPTMVQGNEQDTVLVGPCRLVPEPL